MIMCRGEPSTVQWHLSAASTHCQHHQLLDESVLVEQSCCHCFRCCIWCQNQWPWPWPDRSSEWIWMTMPLHFCNESIISSFVVGIASGIPRTLPANGVGLTPLSFRPLRSSFRFRSCVSDLRIEASEHAWCTQLLQTPIWCPRQKSWRREQPWVSISNKSAQPTTPKPGKHFQCISGFPSAFAAFARNLPLKKKSQKSLKSGLIYFTFPQNVLW